MNWIGSTPFEDLGMSRDMLTLLKELAENSEYWKSASSFIYKVQDRKLSSLTDKQRSWISDIIATLSVELNKRTAKDVFGPTTKTTTKGDIDSIIKGGSW